MIGERTVSGQLVLTIDSAAMGGIEAAFAPGSGMVGCSLSHRGDELLGQRNGLRGYREERSTMGIPLLHPWANRLARASFESAGTAVDVSRANPAPKLDTNGLPIHGLLIASSGWTVEGHAELSDGGRLEASLRFEPELLAGFPFPHSLSIAATLDGNALTVRTTVRADAGSPVPIAFGFHPYFTLPGVPASSGSCRCRCERSSCSTSSVCQRASGGRRSRSTARWVSAPSTTRSSPPARMGSSASRAAVGGSRSPSTPPTRSLSSTRRRVTTFWPTNR